MHSPPELADRISLGFSIRSGNPPDLRDPILLQARRMPLAERWDVEVASPPPFGRDNKNEWDEIALVEVGDDVEVDADGDLKMTEGHRDEGGRGEEKAEFEIYENEDGGEDFEVNRDGEGGEFDDMMDVGERESGSKKPQTTRAIGEWSKEKRPRDLTALEHDDAADNQRAIQDAFRDEQNENSKPTTPRKSVCAEDDTDEEDYTRLPQRRH